MKKLRIAIISPEFPLYTNWGGVARFNQNLAELLSSLGHEVHVFTLGNHSEKLNTAYTLHCFSKRTPFRLVNFLYFKLSFFLFRFLLKKFLPNLLDVIDWNFLIPFYFYPIQKKVQFDVIHTPSYGTPGLSIKLFWPHISLVNHLHGPQYFINQFEDFSLDNTLVSHLENMYIRMCSSLIVSCSNALKIDYLNLFPNLNKKMKTIYNFIDIPKYEDKYDTAINLNNIVCWGRIEKRKGSDILLNSFIRLAKKNPLLKLFFIGEDTKKFEFNKQNLTLRGLLHSLKVTNDISSRIFFLPRIDDYEAMIEILKKLKGIAIFPSRYEPFGFSTIEAMALGFVTVASEHGGASEIITNEFDGFLISPNSNDIQNVLDYIYSTDLKKNNKIISNAKATLKNKFSFQSAKSDYSYKNFYHKLKHETSF